MHQEESKPMQIINYKNIPDKFYERIDFESISSVNEIINDVKLRGDEAVREYAKKFGDGDLEQFELTEKEIKNAIASTSKEIVEAIEQSIENVHSFAKVQLGAIKNLQTEQNGITLGHTIFPIERTGAYVPGGNYPLPSSAIMSCVPAKTAGVKEIIVCSPKIKPATITAAKMAGADRIFRVGGVQAIAAMAYGTETIPQVSKITGPGNKYVTAAKKAVYGVCDIDFLAGPSEVMIIADESANIKFIAADLLAQAEHDPDARAFLITDSEKLAQEVDKQVKEFLQTLKTANIASQSIEKSFIIVVDNIEQSIDIANKKAPEHLEVCINQEDLILPHLKNYGSLFIGNYSAEVLGDYCSGTNHVLPTNSISKYTGGLSVFDFIKIQTYQKVSQKAAKEILCPVASKMAEAEGLYAHKLSADVRMEL